MSAQDNGGPAFPHVYANGEYVTDQGMTLRDYFAAKAMQAILSRDLRGNDLGNSHINHAHVRADPSPSWAAMKAYEIADAMIAARKEGAK